MAAGIGVSETQVVDVGMAGLVVFKLYKQHALRYYSNRMEAASTILTFLRLALSVFLSNEECSEFMMWMNNLSREEWAFMKTAMVQDFKKSVFDA